MALQINTNIAALNAQRNLAVTNRSLSGLLEQLSSGLRVNRAADAAAGLAISEKMRAQIRGMQQGQRNAQDGISMLQTTEGALNEVHSILQRVRELCVQAGNTTLSSSDRQAIGEEMLALTSEIQNIGTRTRFNGQQLLNGSLAVTLDAPWSTADNATAVANGATVSVSTIDVGRAIGVAAYTLSSAAGNLTLSHDNGTGYIISQTVAVNAMGANAEQSIAFDRLGVTIDVTHDANAGNVTGATIAAAFNGPTINTSASSNASFRVGADSGDNIGIAFEDMRASALGDTNKLSGLITNNNAVSTTTKADTLLLSVDAAIAQVSTFRAKLCASQNQMEHAVNSVAVSVENLSASASRIRDAEARRCPRSSWRSRSCSRPASRPRAQPCRRGPARARARRAEYRGPGRRAAHRTAGWSARVRHAPGRAHRGVAGAVRHDRPRRHGERRGALAARRRHAARSRRRR